MSILALLLLGACDGKGSNNLVDNTDDTGTPITQTTTTETGTTATGTTATGTTATGTTATGTTATGTTATGTTTSGLPSVVVNWIGSSPSSSVDVTITDPQGRTGWEFAMAETDAGAAGWYGEDCYLGTGSWQYCHPVTSTTLQLDQEADLTAIVEGSTTLFWPGLDHTYMVTHGSDCYVWGHDITYYGALGCTPINGAIGSGRRGECSGMDPADPVGGLNGRVAFTFDDGPHATVTPQILDTLRAYSIPATFFMLGENAADPALWSIIDDIDQDPLFEIANHSWDHADFTTLSSGDIDDEIDDTHQLLSTWTTPQFFRFPYGNATCAAADTVRNSYGQKVVGWHADTADWCYATGTVGTCNQSSYWRIPTGYENDMIGFTLDQMAAFDGGVLLMHDIHQYTADNLEALIVTLLSNGFSFTSLDDASAYPLLNANTPYDFPWMGESCDTNNDTCWQVEWNSWCEATGDPAQPANQGICVLPCTDWCVNRDGVAPLHCAEALPNEGHCLAQSSSLNNYCGDIPGSVIDSVPEWDDGTPWVDTCVPYGW